MTLADRRPLTNAYEPPLPAVRRWSICGAGLGFGPQSSQTGSQSFHTGQRVALSGPSASIADAVKVQTLGDLTFPRLRRFVDDVERLPDDAIRQAMRIAHRACRLILEPA